jgi:transposase-like protein
MSTNPDVEGARKRCPICGVSTFSTKSHPEGEQFDVFHCRRCNTLIDYSASTVRGSARDPANRAWNDYCQNGLTLMPLDALPWASRREW